MAIKLPKEAHARAVQSLERYWQEQFGERVGNIQAGALLNYFLEEVGPCVYNQAVAELQERLQARVAELDIECHEDEFGYWPRHERKR